ncbi:DUF6804 family protein [Paramicrobacterium sp. CJ85]|uniref:DUF6804 family protein n=1 Tax=Paramicrobacterium sp. CJ85 TaxID=3445355 RepID=UPI003F5E1ECE
MARSTERYPNPKFTRPALAPGLLAGIALMAGAALMTSEWYILIRFAVAILSAIMAVFAIQAKKYLWLILLVPVVVAWNPVVPLPIGGPGWAAAHVFVPIGLVLAGIFIKVPAREDDTRR